jgi:neutral trehalase
LFFGLATKAQAERVAEVVRTRLLNPDSPDELNV